MVAVCVWGLNTSTNYSKYQVLNKRVWGHIDWDCSDCLGVHGMLFLQDRIDPLMSKAIWWIDLVLEELLAVIWRCECCTTPLASNEFEIAFLQSSQVCGFSKSEFVKRVRASSRGVRGHAPPENVWILHFLNRRKRTNLSKPGSSVAVKEGILQF